MTLNDMIAWRATLRWVDDLQLAITFVRHERANLQLAIDQNLAHAQPRQALKAAEAHLLEVIIDHAGDGVLAALKIEMLNHLADLT